ncbi:MAG TPA: polysaccharide biosynthesis/export family protein [Gemmataceae bacterium]|nr:polysaccharide biosynthesis/export family protein [Gemmataceae bacterium]
MIIRGQRKLLLALLAVLGTCLGSTGCQLPTSPVTPTITGGEVGCVRCKVQQTANYPYAPAPAAIAQLSYTPPGDGHSYPPGVDALMPPDDHGPPSPGPLPVELTPSSHPPYTVAPPDILYIDTLRLIPRPPYRIEPLEQLQIIVTNTLPNQPVQGIYVVSPDGTVNLGFAYGAVRIVGMTVEEAQAEIRRHLGTILRDPQVSITLLQYRGLQQTRGQHLVRQDGTISLGTYGCVYVAGLTLGQLKCVIEQHLSKYFLNPQISVDVAAYNSKVYYVITDGGGFGQAIYRFPITGNETVLDAIANIQGLPPVASKRRIQVARPAPCGNGCFQVLPVDWRAITEGGATCTNYQLFPGDRVFVHADRLIALDNWLSKIFAPIERTLGLVLLGSSTVNSLRNNNNNNGTNSGAFIGVVR